MSSRISSIVVCYLFTVYKKNLLAVTTNRQAGKKIVRTGVEREREIELKTRVHYTRTLQLR